MLDFLLELSSPASVTYSCKMKKECIKYLGLKHLKELSPSCRSKVLNIFYDLLSVVDVFYCYMQR